MFLVSDGSRGIVLWKDGAASSTGFFPLPFITLSLLLAYWTVLPTLLAGLSP